MLFFTIIKVAFKSLFANKLRSFLAMLGIIIGVGAVISMLAIVSGAKKNVMERITSMGTNLLVIRAGQRGMHGVRSGDSENLTLKDARAIISGVEGVDMIAPVVNGNAQLKYYNQNARSNVTGVPVTYHTIRNYTVEHGRFFTETETQRLAKLVVLGSESALNLGITSAQIGENIKLNGINFQLIGILKEKGGGGPFNPDEQALIPYTTAMQIVFGKDKLSEIDVQAKPDADVTKLQTDLEVLMRQQHKITGDKEDDFRIFNQAELMETASEFIKTFTFLLGGIAAISLLVGGIGIMNIMLVTVTERTREIGIRKAIGAKDRDILLQFLIESMIMSGVGGIIGVLAGVIGAQVIGSGEQFTTVVEPASVIMALSFAAAVGVFFGYYPAWRAAQLDPIECLYYE